MADFTLDVTVYKPPFKVPFWQGSSSQSYFDPPIGSFGLGPDDEAGIYDEPGQVLSVAMTRAAIFQREDFRTLVEGDHMTVRSLSSLTFSFPSSGAKAAESGALREAICPPSRRDGS